MVAMSQARIDRDVWQTSFISDGTLRRGGAISGRDLPSVDGSIISFVPPTLIRFNKDGCVQRGYVHSEICGYILSMLPAQSGDSSPKNVSRDSGVRVHDMAPLTLKHPSLCSSVLYTGSMEIVVFGDVSLVELFRHSQQFTIELTRPCVSHSCSVI